MGQHYRQASLRAARALTATLGLTISVSGCGSLKRVQDCERVITTVNAGLEQVRLQLPDAGADAYGAIATEYVRLGENIQTLTASRGERKSKQARLKRIRTLAKNDLTREAAAVRKLNALCHPE
jgi:hypothetical protein